MKDIKSRALKTFIQTVLAYFSTYTVAVVSEMDFTKGKAVLFALLGLVISALASGISAVMNLIINYINSKK